MTRDLTIPPGRQTPAERRGLVDLDADAIRSGYRHMRQLLAPFDAWLDLQGRRYGEGEWWKAVITTKVEAGYVERVINKVYTPDTRQPPWRRANAERRDQWLAHVRGKLAELPPLADLVRVRDLVQDAAAQAPSETKTAAIVSATISPFRGRSEAVPLVEATVDLVHAKGYPPAVVAKAKETLLSEGDRKFPPMPGEFLAACDAADGTLSTAARISDKAVKLRQAFEEILQQLEARAPDPEPEPRPEPVPNDHDDPDEIPF